VLIFKRSDGDEEFLFFFVLTKRNFFFDSLKTKRLLFYVFLML